MHTELRHSDPFAFSPLANSCQFPGGAHCSSRPSWHGWPAATSGLHPLPSSGQYDPRAHSGGTVAFANPNGNSSRLHSRGWQVPFVPPIPEQNDASSQSLENLPVAVSRRSFSVVHAVPRVM